MLKLDWMRRAEEAGGKIEAHLAADEAQEAWWVLKGWYPLVKGRAPRPSLQTTKTQTRGRKELYARVPPIGDPLPINVTPTSVWDPAPTNGELRERVKSQLRNGRTGGASGMRAEDLKAWLRGVEMKEKATRDGDTVGAGTNGEGTVGAGDSWRALVALVQAI